MNKDDKSDDNKQSYIKVIVTCYFLSCMAINHLHRVERFQINNKFTLEENLKGVVVDRISYIVDQIRRQEDAQKTIHEIRRSIKRIRAVLRLIRDEIGYSHYHRENLFFRDLARQMAPVRDSYVLCQTVKSLETNHPEVISTNDYSFLKERLSIQIDQDLDRFIGSSGGFERVLTDIGQAEKRIDQYCLLRHDYVSIKKGIRRVYRSGRFHHSRIGSSFDTELLHEYRKTTKYLQFQMELIQPVYPKLLKAHAGTIDKHTELLGDIRDYDRLDFYIQNAVPKEIHSTKRKKLLEIIRKRKEEMLVKVLARSQIIYAEKPKEFIKRIQVYWNQYYQLT